MKFLQNLDELLYKNKMSRSDLARATGLAPSTINSWFNRSCDNVSLISLIKIANYFNISLDVLVNGDIAANSKNNNLTQEEIDQVKRLLAYADKLGGSKV